MRSVGGGVLGSVGGGGLGSMGEEGWAGWERVWGSMGVAGMHVVVYTSWQ